MTVSKPSVVASTARRLRVLIITFLAFYLVVSAEAFANPLQNIIRQASKRLLNYQKQDDKEIMKAWTCHGRNQRDLVDRLMQAGIVQTTAVQKVLELVDRANFTPMNPYMDAPQGIGLGQTISAPHMHAHVLEEIYPYLVGKEDLNLLDVGAGSGYLTAALGRWIQPLPNETPILGSGVKGKVFGLDVHQDLVDLSAHNIRKADADLLDTGVLKIQVGDGWKGLPSEAPFDAIHVGAAADGMPYDLVSQLKVGGVMIIPIGAQTQVQNLYKIERISSKGDPVGFDKTDYRITTLLGVRYVPLVRPNGN
jgi:protein-L-isoaspartate(D-aspartate) O-methyltransferase